MAGIGLPRGLLAAVIVIVLAVSSIAIVSFWQFKPPHKPVIGVLRVEGYLFSGPDLNAYIRAIRYAAFNDSVVAVVVRINSPGGSAAVSEELYNELRSLDRLKPVVASIGDLAASGGYYTALGARYIYAEPTSLVGNVGVIAMVPVIKIPTEAILESGPQKLMGFNLTVFPFLVRTAFQNFLGAVNESRCGKLKIPLSKVGTGQLFLGSVAAKNGLIDGIGSLRDAIEKAAEYAGVSEYAVIDLLEAVGVNVTIGAKFWGNRTALGPSQLRLMDPSPAGIYYLCPYYVRDSALSSFLYGPASVVLSQQAESEETVGDIVFDAAHKNAYNPLLLSEFIGRIVARGLKPVFVRYSADFKKALKSGARALVVINPMQEFTDDEVKAIEQFLDKGGRLVLICDPSVPDIIAANSLAASLGFYFSTGYLYNTKDNYGVYRNIYIRSFANDSIISGVGEAVFFTATSICGDVKPLAWTSRDTCLLVTGRRSNYTVVAIKGGALAIGDSTFLFDPFIYVANNTALANDIITFMQEGSPVKG